jgi:hypothetical protein
VIISTPQPQPRQSRRTNYTKIPTDPQTLTVGIGVVAGGVIGGVCAASVLLGCALATVAVTGLAISVAGGVNASLEGGDYFEGSSAALHDPFNWVNGVFSPSP